MITKHCLSFCERLTVGNEVSVALLYVVIGSEKCGTNFHDEIARLKKQWQVGRRRRRRRKRSARRIIKAGVVQDAV